MQPQDTSKPALPAEPTGLNRRTLAKLAATAALVPLLPAGVGAQQASAASGGVDLGGWREYPGGWAFFDANGNLVSTGRWAYDINDKGVQFLSDLKYIQLHEAAPEGYDHSQTVVQEGVVYNRLDVKVRYNIITYENYP
jgi:hypothetical protein